MFLSYHDKQYNNQITDIVVYFLKIFTPFCSYIKKKLFNNSKNYQKTKCQDTFCKVRITFYID